ncbi:MAG: glycosyltransferase [Bacteroidales bacterium]|nr:glycosyltransferase [Bacteroidales bacterium]
MFISVIIPTYNRSRTLSYTIESLVNQNYPVEKFEIIISDNNSTDNTKDIVEEWIRKTEVKIKYILEKRQGSHYARNSAAKSASGDLLYFTDDDTIADKNLLSEIIKPFIIDDKVGTATGRVLPKWEVEPPDWILKLCYNGYLAINDQGEGLKIEDYDLEVWSCHQAVRKDVFFKSGGFNPDILINKYIGDNETGLNIKIKKSGYKFAYNGKSITYHIIPPHRMTQKYLNFRIGNQGNCDSFTDYKEYAYNNYHLFNKILIYLIKIIPLSMLISLKIFKNLLKYFFFKTKPLNNTWRLDIANIYYYFHRIKYDFGLILSGKQRKEVLKDNWLE